MRDAGQHGSMNVPTLVAIALATFAVLAGTVALFGLGMDDAFSNQTPRLNPGIVALLSASGAALSFMLGILSGTSRDWRRQLLLSFFSVSLPVSRSVPSCGRS